MCCWLIIIKRGCFFECNLTLYLIYPFLSVVDVFLFGVTGFPDRMIERIRAQPATSHLALLRRRLAQLNSPAGTAELLASARVFAQVQSLLAARDADAEIVATGRSVIPTAPAAPPRVALSAATALPGAAPVGPLHASWLFPVAFRDVDAAVAALSGLGVDVYRGATQLAALPPPEASAVNAPGAAPGTAGWRPAARAADAEWAMAHVVYLPVNKRMSEAMVSRVAQAVVAVGGVRKLGQGPILRSSYGNGRSHNNRVESRLNASANTETATDACNVDAVANLSSTNNSGSANGGNAVSDVAVRYSAVNGRSGIELCSRAGKLDAKL